MRLMHVALVCASENNSDTFYRDVLGLEKKDIKVLPHTLSRQIFDLEGDYTIVNYADDSLHVEIFLAEPKAVCNNGLAHVCLEVDDLAEFVDRCRSLGLRARQIPREKGTITFVSDFDGNLFEIKEKNRHS